MEIPVKYKTSVNRYEPIEAHGLTLYPVLVKDHETFETARPALEFLLQTLPVRYATMPLLSALYALEYDTVREHKEHLGIFFRALLLLSLALRIPEGGRFVPHVDPKDQSRLLFLQLLGEDGKTICEIKPVTFTLIRPIIAAQNGVKLHSDSANPELIEAEMDILMQRSGNLDVDFYEMRSTVAMFCGCDDNDIDEWPLLKLQRRQASIRRIIDYTTCAIAEGSGAKWKGGNPCPDPFYDRVRDHNVALQPLDSFAGGAGTKAFAKNQSENS